MFPDTLLSRPESLRCAGRSFSRVARTRAWIRSRGRSPSYPLRLRLLQIQNRSISRENFLFHEIFSLIMIENSLLRCVPPNM